MAEMRTLTHFEQKKINAALKGFGFTLDGRGSTDGRTLWVDINTGAAVIDSQRKSVAQKLRRAMGMSNIVVNGCMA